MYERLFKETLNTYAIAAKAEAEATIEQAKAEKAKAEAEAKKAELELKKLSAPPTDTTKKTAPKAVIPVDTASTKKIKTTTKIKPTPKH